MLNFKYIHLLLLSFFIFSIMTAAAPAQKARHQHHSRLHQHQRKRNCSIIYGKITDAAINAGLPGVNIILKGTNLGAASGPDGAYLIKAVPVGEYTLQASMMGYELYEKRVAVRLDTAISVDFSLTESVIEMNEIVVTGTGMPQLYKNATVKTAVVQRSMIERKKANNLAEAIDFQTGIRVESNCQNCNFTQVRLLGLEGHNSQILIDGNPVISSLAGVYGLEQLPREMIERVEIVKGGGSALYGGQAIAGVINLITRRPTHNDISFDYSSGSIKQAMDHRIGGAIARVNSNGTSRGLLFGTVRQRAPYDHNHDGFSEIGQIKNQAVGANWYFTPSNRSELSVQLHYIHEDRRGGNKFDLAPHEADIAEWIETFRYGGSAAWRHSPTALFDYKAYVSFALTDRNSYYGAKQDPNAYGTTENPLFVTGISTNYLWGRHAISTGIQFKQDAVSDQAVAYNRSIEETYSDLGFIFQDKFTIGVKEKTELVYGARLDNHSAISSKIISPRIALKSSLSNSLIFRGGYSSGFKAPQVFDEDLHITQVGGEGQIIRNSANLKEERGYTFYGGLEFQGIIDVIGVKLSVNGFSTRLTDTFLLTEKDDPTTDEIEFYRINGPGSLVQGVEAECALRLRKAEIISGVTIQSSVLDEPEADFGSKTYLRTPDVYGSLRCIYDISSRFNTMFIAKYTGSMLVPHYAGYIQQDRLEKSDSFLTLDLIVSYRIPLGSRLFGTLTAGAYNITNNFQNDFDSGVYRDAGYIYGPLVPRRFLLGFAVGH